VGDTFRGTLNAPIRDGGDMVVPAGAHVEGRVVDVSSAGPFSGHSELKLELTKLIYQGEVYALQTESYGRAGNGRGKGTAQAVGGTAAVGAALGAMKEQPITFPPETVLTFRLLQPVTVVSGQATSNPRTRLQETGSYPQEPPPVQLPPPPLGAPPIPPL
jgi:hypothetical protein